VNKNDLFSLLPYIALGSSAIVVMLVLAFKRNHIITNIVSLSGIVISFVLLFAVSPFSPRQITPLMIIDGYGLFFTGLILFAVFVISVLSFGYLDKRGGDQNEFYLLLLLAAFGSTVLVVSNHFASFFLGLEILSVSLYALIAYPKNAYKNIEAGIKYLILAAFSSAFLLFGMALVYAELGTMEFGKIAVEATEAGHHNLFVLSGFAMIVVGIGFKLAVVPFHLWTPDVYEGAPAPVTSFIATVSKGAVFALLLRYFTKVDIHLYGPLIIIFAVIAISSMIIGNLLALLQSNVKRILAYSSIAHLGYLLVAFQAGGKNAVTAVSFYLAAYFLATLGAFGVITVLSSGTREADNIEDYRGLAWKRPWLAGVFTMMVLSLAGMPLTAGFLGKFYLVSAGVGSFLWLQVIVFAVSSAIGLFYYLRIINVMCSGHVKGEQVKAAPPSFSMAAGIALTFVMLLLILLGIYPSPLIEIIQKTSAGLI